MTKEIIQVIYRDLYRRVVKMAWSIQVKDL